MLSQFQSGTLFLILDILWSSYLLGVILIGIVVGFSVFKVGGWDNMATSANVFAKRIDAPIVYTSNRIQWMCAFIIFAWPVAFYYLIRGRLRS